MANNRMGIECEGCGAYKHLAKHYMRPWFTEPAEGAPRLDVGLDAWFDKHFWCADPWDDGAHFRLVYEHDPTGRAEARIDQVHPPARDEET